MLTNFARFYIKKNMTKRKFITSCLLTIVLLGSCDKKRESVNLNDCISEDEKFTLIKDEANKVSFSLDSVTTPNISYLKYTTLGDSLYFSFLNPFNNSIYLYDYSSRNLAKTISLTSDKKISAYEIISKNLIAAYQKKTYDLTLQDDKGSIKKTINIPPQKGSNGYYSYPTTHASLIHRQGKLYLVGGHLSNVKVQENSHCVAEINIDSEEFKYLYQYPEIYQKYFFGGSHYRMDISYDYNSNEDVFVVSFPASHKLYKTADFITDTEFCASSSLTDMIDQYPYDNQDKTFDYVSENLYYHSIKYDPYNNVYYRLCLLPLADKESEVYSRDLSVVILDQNLNKIGEKVLKNFSDYYLGNIASIHVSPDGLLFQKKNYKKDESSINFTIYKLAKL